jgi:ornithine cyclodeaminase/alanine dehydrogenase-like protein (mu-crystallin family)
MDRKLLLIGQHRFPSLDCSCCVPSSHSGDGLDVITIKVGIVMVLVLTDNDVASVLGMKDGIRIMEQAFREHASGSTVLLPRVSHNLAGSGGSFRVLAAVLPGLGWFGLKSLTGYPGRRLAGETYFEVLLFETTSGALRAVIAGNHLTGIRTGAATGVAAKYLAREDADVLGIFGVGVQAKNQLDALMAVRPLRLVKVLSRDRAKTVAFADWVSSKYGVRAHAAQNAREVIAGSSLVVAATTSREPLFAGEWLEAGTHLSGIGANMPGKSELDPTCFARSKVVVDFRQQAIDEAGDLRNAFAAGAIQAGDIYAELGEVVSGTKMGRTDDSELTLFKSVGVAIQDVATAAFAYEQASEQGIGTKIELEDIANKQVQTV